MPRPAALVAALAARSGNKRAESLRKLHQLVLNSPTAAERAGLVDAGVFPRLFQLLIEHDASPARSSPLASSKVVDRVLAVCSVLLLDSPAACCVFLSQWFDCCAGDHGRFRRARLLPSVYQLCARVAESAVFTHVAFNSDAVIRLCDLFSELPPLNTSDRKAGGVLESLRTDTGAFTLRSDIMGVVDVSMSRASSTSTLNATSEPQLTSRTNDSSASAMDSSRQVSHRSSSAIRRGPSSSGHLGVPSLKLPSLQRSLARTPSNLTRSSRRVSMSEGDSLQRTGPFQFRASANVKRDNPSLFQRSADEEMRALAFSLGETFLSRDVGMLLEEQRTAVMISSGTATPSRQPSSSQFRSDLTASRTRSSASHLSIQSSLSRFLPASSRSGALASPAAASTAAAGSSFAFPDTIDLARLHASPGYRVRRAILEVLRNITQHHAADLASPCMPHACNLVFLELQHSLAHPLLSLDVQWIELLYSIVWQHIAFSLSQASLGYPAPPAACPVLDPFLHRLRVQLIAQAERPDLARLALLLHALYGVMQLEDAGPAMAVYVREAVFEPLLGVKHALWHNPRPLLERASGWTVVHYLLLVLDMFARQASEFWFLEFWSNIFLEREDSLYFVASYTAQLLLSRQVQRDLSSAAVTSADVTPASDLVFCRIPEWQQHARGAMHHWGTVVDVIERMHDPAAPQDCRRRAPSLLRRLELLLLPGIGVLPRLLARDDSDVVPIQQQAAQMIQRLCSLPWNPLALMRSYIDPYISTYYAQFVRVYNAPDFGIEQHRFCVNYLSVLMAFAQSHSPDAARMFQHLGLVPYLVSELTLEQDFYTMCGGVPLSPLMSPTATAVQSRRLSMASTPIATPVLGRPRGRSTVRSASTVLSAYATAVGSEQGGTPLRTRSNTVASGCVAAIPISMGIASPPPAASSSSTSTQRRVPALSLGGGSGAGNGGHGNGHAAEDTAAAGNGTVEAAPSDDAFGNVSEVEYSSDDSRYQPPSQRSARARPAVPALGLAIGGAASAAAAAVDALHGNGTGNGVSTGDGGTDDFGNVSEVEYSSDDSRFQPASHRSGASRPVPALAFAIGDRSESVRGGGTIGGDSSDSDAQRTRSFGNISEIEYSSDDSRYEPRRISIDSAGLPPEPPSPPDDGVIHVPAVRHAPVAGLALRLGASASAQRPRAASTASSGVRARRQAADVPGLRVPARTAPQRVAREFDVAAETAHEEMVLRQLQQGTGLGMEGPNGPPGFWSSSSDEEHGGDDHTGGNGAADKPGRAIPPRLGLQLSRVASSPAALDAAIPEGEESDQDGPTNMEWYAGERMLRRVYCSAPVHAAIIHVLLRLLISSASRAALDPHYCSEYPFNTHAGFTPLWTLHRHLCHPANQAIVLEVRARARAADDGTERLLRLLSTSLFTRRRFTDLVRVGRGAYGTVFACWPTNARQHTGPLIAQPARAGNASKLNTARSRSSQVAQAGGPLPVIAPAAPLAAKLVPVPRGAADRVSVIDVYSEICILDRWRSDPRIVRIVDYGVASKHYWIVMERHRCSLRAWRLALGRTVETLQQHRALLLRVFLAVLEVCRFLIDFDVVHFDLKCDNFLLQPLPGVADDVFACPDKAADASISLPFKMVLTDFGSARVGTGGERGDLTFRHRGTECIKSPEMLLMDRSKAATLHEYDRRRRAGAGRPCDVWAIGCLFFELMTGKYLFHDDEDAETMAVFSRVTDHDQPLLRDCDLAAVAHDPELTGFLDWVLVRDPVQRPSMSDVIARARALFPAS